MKIAILGDSHDHYENLQKAVDLANKHKCGLMLHTGDLGAPGSTVAILKKFNGQVKMILGNNDAEIVGLMRMSFEIENFELIKTARGGDSYEEEVGGVKIFMHHYPRIAEIAAKSTEFDLCIFGHTHKYHEEVIDNTLLLNPSAINASREPAAMVIYDTTSRSHEKILL